MVGKVVIKLFVNKSIYSAAASQTGMPTMLQRGGASIMYQNRYAGYYSDRAFDGHGSAERDAEKLVAEICERYGIEFVVYDFAKKRDMLHASILGIKSTPAVVVGEKVITGKLSKTKILRALGLETKTNARNTACPYCATENIEVCDDGSGSCNECGKVFMEAKDV